MQKKPILLILLIILVVAFFISPISDYPFYFFAKPPKRVIDIDSYLKWKPKTKVLYRFSQGPLIYYVFTGPSGRLLASGPSAYCFDSNYNFVGWTPDIGDAKYHLPEKVYNNIDSLEEINVKEFIQYIENIARKENNSDS